MKLPVRNSVNVIDPHDPMLARTHRVSCGPADRGIETLRARLRRASPGH